MKILISKNIDISEVIEEFQLDKSQVAQISSAVKENILLELARNWEESAKRSLHQTRDGYIKGLAILDNGPFSGSVVLRGALNNMIESGVSPFDIKKGFEQSNKVKFNKKGGWYLTIPFRIATPSASGFSSVFAGVMPQEIYDIVKNFSGKQTNLGTGNVANNKPDRLSQSNIPAPFDALGIRKPVKNQITKNIFSQYTHKSSIYAGLQKDEKFYEAATQGTYNTFRRAGANSDPMSWIHTGIKAHNLAEEAIKNTDFEIITDNTVDKILSSFGF